MMNGEVRPADRILSAAIAGLLLISTLGEGGGSVTGLVVWHSVLVAIAVGTLVFAPPAARGLAGRPLPAFALFLLLFGLGAARVDYAYAAWLEVIELGACLLAAMLAARVGPSLVSSLVWPLRLAGAAHGLFVIGQWAQGLRRPPGTFLNPNHLALWLVAVALVSVGVGARLRASRLLLIATLLPTGAAVALAGSRGAMLGAGVGAAWLLAMRWPTLARRWRTAAVAVLLVLGTLTAFGLAQRMRSADPFRYQRLRIWRASLGVLADDPWWGSGPGRFAGAAANHAFADGDPPLRYDRVFSASHSDPIRVMAEFGLPAALALFAALGFAAIDLTRRRREAGLPVATDGAIAALLAVAVHALVDNASRWSSVYLLSCVLLGCLLSAARPGALRAPLRLRATFAGLLVFVFCAGDVMPYLAWRNVAGLQRGRLDPGGELRLRRAIGLNPLHPDYRMRLAEHIAGDGSDWRLEGYAEAREQAEHAVRLDGSAARQRGLARIEALACRTILPVAATQARAVRAFERAERDARFDPFAPLARAALLIDTGDPGAGRRAAERALTLEPGAVLPRLVLADAFIESGSEGDLLRAEELLEAAREALAAGGPIQGGYAHRLMRPDPAVLVRLEAKLRERRAGSAP